MPAQFTTKDLEVFQIPGFQERMAALKARIRPKLEALGESIGPLLMKQFKREFFAHTAKHMRRKVNPPDETWVALGPQLRGYKAYIHFAFCVGKGGAQARVVMKDESQMRKALGENLIANLAFFERHGKEFSGLNDYTRRDAEYRPFPIRNMADFIKETADRLTKLKSSHFDVGVELKLHGSDLERQLLKTWEKLSSFYECGLQKGVRLR